MFTREDIQNIFAIVSSIPISVNDPDAEKKLVAFRSILKACSEYKVDESGPTAHTQETSAVRGGDIPIHSSE